MKNRWLVFMLGLLMVVCLLADEPFFLINNPSQLGDSEPFVMARDLFRFDSKAASLSSDLSQTDPLLTPQQPPLEKAGDDPAQPPPAPLVDLVLLGTILRQNKRCALLSLNGDILVMDEGEEMPNGWRIEKITTTRVTVKAEQNSMMLALEGEEHE